MSLAAVFPGQGSQYLGMGLDMFDTYPAARDIFATAEAILDRPFSRLVSEGPKDLLDDTVNAQPAIFTVNYIYWLAWQRDRVEPDYLAGHSLGEVSACLAAGVFSFEDGLLVVKKRAELMSNSPGEGGGMMAVLGLDDKRAAEVAAAAGLEPANYNCPGQVVVAGTLRRLEEGIGAFKEAGAKKVVKLAVSGPFHSSAMLAAGGLFAEWLEGVRFDDPKKPVIANASAEPVLSGAAVKKALVKQLTSPVLWGASIERLVELGVDVFVETGPGRVLSGLIKRIAPAAKIAHVGDRRTS